MVHEFEEMVEFAREKKIMLAVNYTRRWQNSFILAKKIVDTGKMGNIRAVTAYYSGRFLISDLTSRHSPYDYKNQASFVQCCHDKTRP